MTPEDAIIAIKSLKLDIKWALYFEYYEALGEATRALEKQVPKEVVDAIDDTADCPTCGCILNYHKTGWCEECGQRYVWTED